MRGASGRGHLDHELSSAARIAYGDPIPGQTGRLFLPVDLMVGRDVLQDVTLSLELSVPVIKDYPVYNFRTGRCLAFRCQI